jgi:RNA recognition motif-containing protein
MPFPLVGQMLEERALTVREDKAPADRPGAADRAARGDSMAPRSNFGEVAAGDGCKYYLGNLSWGTTEESVIAHFGNFGVSVVHCEVARQSGGRSKGWARVVFASVAEAEDAVGKLHDSELDSRAIILRVERQSGGGAQNNARAVPVQRGVGVPRDERPENSSGLQIVVRSLAWTTTTEELLQVFQQIGNVINAEVPCHSDTGRSKGWGTVLFETPEQAQAAIDGFNGVELAGRAMQIRLDRYA